MWGPFMGALLGAKVWYGPVVKDSLGYFRGQGPNSGVHLLGVLLGLGTEQWG